MKISSKLMNRPMQMCRILNLYCLIYVFHLLKAKANLQSSIPATRFLVMFTVMRQQTKTVAMIINVMLMPRTVCAREGGSMKFGIILYGGTPPGICDKSLPGGRSARLMLSSKRFKMFL